MTRKKIRDLCASIQAAIVDVAGDKKPSALQIETAFAA